MTYLTKIGIILNKLLTKYESASILRLQQKNACIWVVTGKQAKPNSAEVFLLLRGLVFFYGGNSLKICKVINNNVVSCIDEHGQEAVVMGRGLGFQAKPGMKLERCGKDFSYGFSGRGNQAQRADCPDSHRASGALHPDC